MISWIIIEDIEDYRNALVSVLGYNENYVNVGAFKCAEDVLGKISALLPDVALVDINLPGMNGIELVKYIKSKSPNTQCIMCTSVMDSKIVMQAIIAGAFGYILKSSSPNKIIEAISEVVNGGSPMSAEIARMVLFQMQAQATEVTNLEVNYHLTLREKEVLDLLSKGLFYKEIAVKLNIGIDTVKKHCYNIYEKLHVSNRTEALNKYNKL